MQSLAEIRQSTNAQHLYPSAVNVLTALPLTEDDRDEVLEFLSERPIHTFGLAGFIRDNGVVSPHNRGTFYACRDEAGQLEGVALIGHFILFEARTERAIAAFARVAQQCTNAHLLLAEQEDAQTFWTHYWPEGQPVRLYCRELLFEQRWPIAVREPVDGLRLATMDDLDLIVPAHAETVVLESGINPLETDPEGFRARCARRIEMNKTWVWVEDSKLIFKAEIVSDTEDVIYLEGVWVNPQERGNGYGSRCTSQLCRILLQRTKSVCILVNDKFKSAQSVYKKVGFKFVAYYDTMFLKQE
ncbi:MAG TPA: GNAT family N-acetyltransferase [Blastocatellia bacterium]|nr:GNAT family N-acetyltransferase [Blastocatellia bacterium]